MAHTFRNIHLLIIALPRPRGDNEENELALDHHAKLAQGGNLRMRDAKPL